MKKKNIFILALSVMLISWKTGTCGSYFVTNVVATPITSASLKVQRVTEANPNDSTYLVLYTGIDTFHYNQQSGITMITKYSQNGTIIWSYKYRIAAVGMALSKLLGYGIAVDNNQNIVVGGYLTTDGSTNEDFVMHLQSNGTYGVSDWFTHWNNHGGKGVTDLLFSHDANNTGSVAAVSIDFDVSHSVANLFVTTINTTGALLKQYQLDDHTANYGVAAINDIFLKPRIMQSDSFSSYMVIGTRTFTVSGMTKNDISYFYVKYDFTLIRFWEIKNNYTGNPNIFAVSATEEDGALATHPTIYIAGYMDTSGVYNPLVIQINGINSTIPLFHPEQILPSTTIPAGKYYYASDIAFNKTFFSSHYHVMVTCNLYNGSAAYTMQVFNVTVPIPLSTPPTLSGTIINYGGIFPVNGTLDCITNTVNPDMYMMAGEDLHDNLVLARTDASLSLCATPITASTNFPWLRVPEINVGTQIFPSLTSGTPNDSAISKTRNLQCSGTVGGGGNDIAPIKFFGQQSDVQQGTLIVNQLNKNFISAYPNPVSDKINIDLIGETNASIMIYIFDMCGREAMSQSAVIKSGTNHIIIYMQTLAKGTYLIKITNPVNSINIYSKIEKY